MEQSESRVQACAVPSRETTTVQTPQSLRSVGERFARSLTTKDPAAMKELLQPGVDFRALTPGRFWESTDVDVIVDETILGTWFGSDKRIVEVLGLATEDIESLGRVSYRFKVERPEGQFVVEQQAYYKTDGKAISWLRIMCTGFLPIGD